MTNTENNDCCHIENEASILEIPVFYSHSHSIGSTLESSSTTSIKPEAKRRSSSSEQSVARLNSTASTDTSIQSTCECPNVLVSDDDPFQRFFYETVFNKSLTDNSTPEKESFKFELFASGEALIQRYKQLKSCGCDKTVVIITDYNMGKDNLTGVETIIALKEAGYSGGAVLRTSEEKEDLEENDSDFKELVISGTLCCFVEKSNINKMKCVTQKIMGKIKKMREEGLLI